MSGCGLGFGSPMLFKVYSFICCVSQACCVLFYACLDFKVYLPICGKVHVVGVCVGGWFKFLSWNLACRCTKDMNSLYDVANHQWKEKEMSYKLQISAVSIKMCCVEFVLPVRARLLYSKAIMVLAALLQ
jgi:hypothetical protein